MTSLLVGDGVGYLGPMSGGKKGIGYPGPMSGGGAGYPGVMLEVSRSIVGGGGWGRGKGGGGWRE